MTSGLRHDLCLLAFSKPDGRALTWCQNCAYILVKLAGMALLMMAGPSGSCSSMVGAVSGSDLVTASREHLGQAITNTFSEQNTQKRRKYKRGPKSAQENYRDNTGR